jgi:hypothetical protein
LSARDAFCYGIEGYSLPVSEILTLSVSTSAFSPAFPGVTPMANNKKCPNCGFINFLKAETCHKCNTALDGSYIPDSSYSNSPEAYAPAYQHQQPAARKGFPLLKVFLCLFAGLLVFSALTGAGVHLLKHSEKVSWQEFRPSGAVVRVMMPKAPVAHEPIKQMMSFGSITNHMYTSTIRGQGSAVLMVVDFSVDLSSAEDRYDSLLDQELNSLVKRTNSTLVNKQPIVVGGKPGLQFEMKPPSNYELPAARTFGKFFLANNQLYLLGITASEDSELFSTRETFLNPANSYF